MNVWSRYNRLLNSRRHGYFIYNAMTNGFLKIDKKLFDHLKNVEIGKSDLDLKEDAIIEILKESRVLVDVDEDRQFVAKQKLLYYKSNLETNFPRLVICPTSACNFECTYCFEEIPNANTISKSNQDQIVEFADSFEKKKVAIKWFGGEPLLSFNSMQNILNGIKDRGVEIVHHSIITNGYLINDKVCDFFNDYALNRIQITFDGLEATHDKKRVLKNGKGTFEKIIKSVDLLIEKCPKLKINIRFNIDKDNMEEYGEFCTIYNKKWDLDNIVIYPAFIKDYTGACGCECLDTKQKEFDFFKSLKNNNDVSFNYYPKLRNGACMANNIYSYVVGPKGELYKCMADFGIKNRIVGCVDSEKGSNDNIVLDYLIRHNKYEDAKCLECDIFPVCSGGCTNERMSLSKNMHLQKENLLCDVRKKFLDEMLELHLDKTTK